MRGKEKSGSCHLRRMSSDFPRLIPSRLTLVVSENSVFEGNRTGVENRLGGYYSCLGRSYGYLIKTAIWIRQDSEEKRDLRNI